MAMNDSQLTTQANVIKNETATGANTATRVGTMLDDIISNKINNDKIDTNGTLAANSDALVASQKATKTYVDAGLALKEDTANKSNAALGASATLFPTQNAVKTYVDGQVVIINGSITSGLALKENTANKSNGPLGTSAILFPTENSVTNALVPKENISDKVTTQATFISNGSSVVKYPAIKAVKDYVDGVTTGLLKDNGNYDPTITSNYPTAADTLSGGPIQVGDLWYIDTNGTMNGNAVLVGYSVRALVNAAGPTTNADWAIANVGLGFVPENSANKSTDGTFNSGVPSATLFPTQSAVATYVAANAQDLDQVLTSGNIGTSNLVIGNTLTTPINTTTLSPGVVQLQDTILGTAVFAVDGITLDDATATNQMVITYNNNNQNINFPSSTGTLALTSDIPAAGWGLTGNTGTTAGVNFIGTTDAEDVIFKANGVERMKIDNIYGDVYTTNSFRALNLSTSTAMQAIGAGGSYAIMGQDSGTYGGGYLTLGNTGGRAGVIRCDNITLADREFQLPDANGTFVLSVNGSAPDAAGNITVAVSAPSLSAVTAVGNTTTSDIIVNGVTGSRIEVAESVGLGIARIGYTTSWKGHLLLNNGTSSGVIKATNLTASRIYDLPDAGGTLALESYKSYTIRLGWDGANWTAVTIYQNTLGGAVTLSDFGGTRMMLTSSGLFTLGKTVVIPIMIGQVQSTKIGVLDTAFIPPTVNDIYIRWNDTTGALAAPFPFGTSTVILEVRVYP